MKKKISIDITTITEGCNGDPHAVAKECPVPCPATCDMPEPMLTCKRECDPIGCECESGYILSDGKCIYPDDCEGEKMFNFNDNNYKVNVRAKSDLMRYKISSMFVEAILVQV